MGVLRLLQYRRAMCKRAQRLRQHAAAERRRVRRNLWDAYIYAATYREARQALQGLMETDL